METKFINYSRENGVLRLVLSRPDVLNSFNLEMGSELLELVAGAAADDQVRALLLTGEGRAFCAGQDLAAVAPSKDDVRNPGPIVAECYNPLILAMRKLAKPIVCAVNGVAAGAGANLALACDLVLASEKASFIQSFCKIGLVPDSGGTYFLPRLVGVAQATALMMLGDKVSAEQALQLGLIYKVCAHDSLLDDSGALAEHLATQPTTGLGLIKRAINSAWDNDLEQQLTLEREFQQLAGETSDYREGVVAFLEKRAAQFTGK